MTDQLHDKQYFTERAQSEMAHNLEPVERTIQEELAYTGRILAANGHEAGLAGQISARSQGAGAMWTMKFGLGFDEATADAFLELDQDMRPVAGGGMGNPATRFHLWVYKSRPDVNCIVHAHSPWIAALVAARKPLVVAQMDMTPFYDDCAFLPEWPGNPIGDEEGLLIAEHLGTCRSIILSNHGYLTTGRTVAEATYLAVLIERAARIQIRASAFGEIKPVSDEAAKDAHDFLLKDRFTKTTFDYWCRQVDRAA